MSDVNKLLRLMMEDSGQYRGSAVLAAEAEKRRMIRSLMNIRMPKEISQELQELQDDYLREQLEEKGIVDPEEIPSVKERYGSRVPHGEKLSLWQGDITRLKVDAIVNAANSQMLGCFVPCHRCIDNAIHSAAGMQLREECNRIMTERRRRYGKDYEEPTGTATLTKAYNLPCAYVIHTVGPIVYNGLDDTHRRDLRNCYKNALDCCVENQIRTVAFCCISTGEFHFPNEAAAEIALETAVDFLDGHDRSIDRIIFNVFKDGDREIYEKLFKPAL